MTLNLFDRLMARLSRAMLLQMWSNELKEENSTSPTIRSGLLMRLGWRLARFSLLCPYLNLFSSSLDYLSTVFTVYVSRSTKGSLLLNRRRFKYVARAMAVQLPIELRWRQVPSVLIISSLRRYTARDHYPRLIRAQSYKSGSSCSYKHEFICSWKLRPH